MARFLVLIACLCFWFPAYAATCFSGSGTKTFGTEAAACDALASKNCANAYYGNGAHVITYSSGGMCYGKCTADNLQREQYFGSISTSTADACTGDGPDCASKPTLGSASTSWSYAGEYPGYGGGYCIGGCSYDLHGSESYDKKSGMSAAVGSMKPTGGSCSSTTKPVTGDPVVNTADPSTVPPPSSPNPSGCASGGVPYTGTVNGKSVTVCGSATKTSTTDATQKDSSSTRTDSGGTTSGSGSETTTTKTTCADGKCTTTTTKTDSVNGGASAPGGSQGSQTETKTESQADYCKDNPTQPICKEDGDSSFGGSCGAFNCDGDAIQCAIAREQHQRNCQLFDDRTPMTEIGEGAAGAGNRPSDHPGNNPEDIDVGARMAGVARDNPFGDACPRDFDLAVMGNVVTVPLSNACDVLKLMGEIAVAFAFIAAARIVMSGVSSGAT